MERKKRIPNVLSFDPSLTAFGWVVMNKDTVIDKGCIKTEPNHKKQRIRKGDDDMRRVSEINAELLRIVKKYKIIYIVSELPHGSQNASASNALGMVKGAVQALSDFYGVGLEWFSEADGKKAILRKNTATKKEIINRVDEIFKVDWTGIKYKDEAIADALAIYYCAQLHSHVVRTFKNL
jgi:Holliday junction resolvasome RuvABC endonuclease subunit